MAYMYRPWSLTRAPPLRARRFGPGGPLGLELFQPLAKLSVLVGQVLLTVRQHRIVAPPVDAHLLRLVDGDDQESDLDGEQLDLEEVHPDVAGDDDALVEHPL